MTTKATETYYAKRGSEEEIGGFGVDTASCVVGAPSILAELVEREDELSPTGVVGEGVGCTTGLGDGYYPILRGPGHEVRPDAAIVVEFLPATYRVERTDVDGTINYDQADYDPAATRVSDEVIVDLADGVLMVIGDPTASSCRSIERINVEPGRYAIRTIKVDLEGMWGTRTCLVAVERV